MKKFKNTENAQLWTSQTWPMQMREIKLRKGIRECFMQKMRLNPTSGITGLSLEYPHH